LTSGAGKVRVIGTDDKANLQTGEGEPLSGMAIAPVTLPASTSAPRFDDVYVDVK
jgi:hypothetical protein